MLASPIIVGATVELRQGRGTLRGVVKDIRGVTAEVEIPAANGPPRRVKRALAFLTPVTAETATLDADSTRRT